MPQADCTLLILTYKGKHHLKYLLPTIQEVIKRSRFLLDVWIVDNASDIETNRYVNTAFPFVKYFFSVNNDYLFSLNDFVKKVESKFVFILNDDMRLHPEVVDKTLPLLTMDDSLFAVTCNIMDWEGNDETTGVRNIIVKQGWPFITVQQPSDVHPYYTWFAGGGAAIFRTNLFNVLGGFDTLFRPAYAEDGDLSMRAWYRGWEIVYHPGAILYHREGGTIANQKKADELTVLTQSHRLVMFIRNLRSSRFLLLFLIYLPIRMMLSIIKDTLQFRIYFRMLLKIPIALIKRSQDTGKLISHNSIESLIGKKYEK